MPFLLPPDPGLFYAVFAEGCALRMGGSTVLCPPHGREYPAVVAPCSRRTWTPKGGDVVVCTAGGESCKAPVCILGRCRELSAEDLRATWPAGHVAMACER